MLEISPEIIGYNKDIMLEALERDVEYIKYDRTNDEEVYKKAIMLELQNLEKEDVESSDYDAREKIKALKYYIEELENPKQVDEGKYKVPHKYMFEEIRKRVSIYKYHLVDGRLDKQFAEEAKSLYEDSEYFVGIHGTQVKTGETYDDKIKSIFKNGIYCIKYNDWYNDLKGNVLFGEDLTFLNMLEYNIPGYGAPDIAVVLRIPRRGLDDKKPIPIWGSDVESRCVSCVEIINEGASILPEFVYGVYTKHDDVRHITRNDEKEKKQYKYLVYDKNSAYYNRGAILNEPERQKE